MIRLYPKLLGCYLLDPLQPKKKEEETRTKHRHTLAVFFCFLDSLLRNHAHTSSFPESVVEQIKCYELVPLRELGF